MLNIKKIQKTIQRWLINNNKYKFTFGKLLKHLVIKILVI